MSKQQANKANLAILYDGTLAWRHPLATVLAGLSEPEFGIWSPRRLSLPSPSSLARVARAPIPFRPGAPAESHSPAGEWVGHGNDISNCKQAYPPCVSFYPVSSLLLRSCAHAAGTYLGSAVSISPPRQLQEPPANRAQRQSTARTAPARRKDSRAALDLLLDPELG